MASGQRGGRQRERAAARARAPASERPRADVVDLVRRPRARRSRAAAAARATNTGASATSSSATASTGRSARWVAIRHSARSESRSSDCRNAPPVAARTRPGIGGTCASSQRLAARRSSRTSAAAERRRGEQQRQPDPGHAERGAEDQQRRPPGSASSVTGSVDDEVGDGVPGAGEAAVELERGDHDRPSTATSPDALSTCTRVRRVVARRRSRARARSPDVLSASRS